MNALDHQQISELLALHAFLTDENRLERLDELFTPDAVYDMSASGLGVFEGLELLRSAAERMHASGRAPLAHLVTNVMVSSTGDASATVRSKGLMLMADGSPHAVTYDDEVRRQDGGWRIARRVITPAGQPAMAH